MRYQEAFGQGFLPREAAFYAPWIQLCKESNAKGIYAQSLDQEVSSLKTKAIRLKIAERKMEGSRVLADAWNLPASIS